MFWTQKNLPFQAFEPIFKGELDSVSYFLYKSSLFSMHCKAQNMSVTLSMTSLL